MSSKARVAVLGTGIMGSAVARNLLRAGMGVRVWNRTRSRAELLQRDGAQVAASPAEAAQGVDFLITLLPEASVIEEVVGRDVLASLASGGVWLQMSTVGIEGCERLGRIAAESGVAYVDAPVLGTRQPAEEGTLVVLASGPEELRERCRPIFDAIGRRTLWLGPAGMGSRLKLVTNNWIAGFLGALAETLALAEAIGVDPARFFEAIESGPLDTPFARSKGSDDARAELRDKLHGEACAEGCPVDPGRGQGQRATAGDHRGGGVALRRGDRHGARRGGHVSPLPGGARRPPLKTRVRSGPLLPGAA